MSQEEIYTPPKTLNLSLQNSISVCEIDEEDFERLSKFKWYLTGNKTGVYRGIYTGNGKTKLLANEIMNDFESSFDHKDRNIFNNKKQNLRPCSHSLNMGNRAKWKNTSSKYKGVSWNCKQKKWAGRLMKDNIRYYLGSFETEIEAAIEYNKYAIKHFGEFALLNKDEKGSIL